MSEPAVNGPSSEGSRPLWRDRNFGIFWVAQTLSVVGDSFALIALPLLVLHATGSVAQMGLLTAVGRRGLAPRRGFHAASWWTGWTAGSC